MGVALGAAVLLLSACGEGETTTTSSVLTIGATNYDTLPTTPSTVPLPTSTTGPSVTPPGQTIPPGGVTTEVTEYTIKDGDYPSKVAAHFGITLDALQLANADTAGYSAFYVGLKIKIPAGATIPTDDSPETTGVPGETTTTVSTCAQGSYTIEDGDIPATVAKKFDVTVAQLDAANVNTKGYKNFVVGVKIIIPASNAESC